MAGLAATVSVFALEKYEIISFAEKKEPGFDVEAWTMVTSYRGEDETGDSILDIMNAIIDKNYPDPEVLLQGTSFVEWTSKKDSSRGDRVYQVDFLIDTVIEKRSYTWYVDKTTGKISSGNLPAQELLDMVNSEP